MSEENQQQAPTMTSKQYEDAKQLAQRIYLLDAARIKPVGGDTVAKNAFAMALPFVKVAEQFRSGEFVPVDLTEKAKPKMVPVKLTDPDTGEIVTQMMEQVDYCLPNASPDHPDNQRSNCYVGPNLTDIRQG
jgi:hypothetical protein